METKKETGPEMDHGLCARCRERIEADVQDDRSCPFYPCNGEHCEWLPFLLYVDQIEAHPDLLQKLRDDVWIFDFDGGLGGKYEYRYIRSAGILMLNDVADESRFPRLYGMSECSFLYHIKGRAVPPIERFLQDFLIADYFDHDEKWAALFPCEEGKEDWVARFMNVISHWQAKGVVTNLCPNPYLDGTFVKTPPPPPADPPEDQDRKDALEEATAAEAEAKALDAEGRPADCDHRNMEDGVCLSCGRTEASMRLLEAEADKVSEIVAHNPFKGLEVRPTRIPQNEESMRLYELEREINATFKLARKEWCKYMRLPLAGNLWEVAIPTGIYDFLNSWQTDASIIAATVFLKGRGFRVLPGMEPECACGKLATHVHGGKYACCGRDTCCDKLSTFPEDD